MGNVALILEYEAGCNREQHLSAAGMDIAQAGVFVDALAALAERVDSHFIWRPQLKEPSDEMVLEAAVNGRAQAIVTFKRRDFGTVPERFGFRVLLPRDAFKKGLRVTDTSSYPLRLPKSVKAAAEKLAREEGVTYKSVI